MAKQRVQVQGVGEAPVVAPVALPGFQYGIAQRKAGTNNLLQLAGNLEQVGLITKGYAGIVQQQQQREQALERGKAAQFKEQQIEEQRRQAEAERRQAEAERQLAKQQRIHEDMLKNHINTDMLPLLQSREGEVLDVEKYTSKAEASQHLDTIIGQARQGVIDLLGEGVANSLPSQLLVNSVIPKWKTTALDKYEKAQDDYTIDQENVQLMETLRAATTGPIDVINIQAIAEGHEKIMQEKGIDDATDRQRILENGFFATLDTLKAKGRYKDARSLMNVMSLAKVDGRRAFGSNVNQEKLNRYSVSLSEEEGKQRTVSKTTQQQIYQGYYKTALQGLSAMTKFNYELEAHHTAALKGLIEPLSTALADNPQALEQTIQTIVNSSNPTAALRAKLFELSNDPDAPDLAKELYIGNVSKLSAVEQAIFERPTLGVNLQEPYKREQEEEFKQWASQQDKPPTVRDFIESQEKKYTPWTELEQLGIEAEAKGAVLTSKQYKDVDSNVGRMMRFETEMAYGADPSEAEELQIEDTYRGESGREFQRSATQRIQEALKAAAPEGDKEINNLLRDLERQEKERWLRIVNAKKDSMKMKTEAVIKDGELIERDEPVEDIQKARTKRVGGFFDKPVAYPSLMFIERGRPLNQVDRSVVEKDREDMKETGKYQAARRSYYNYGLTTYNRAEIKRLDELDLDVDDVLLFGSRLEAEMKVEEWQQILRKDLEGEQLTAEEEKIAEEYIELGIYNEQTYFDFVAVQFDLIDRPRRPL
jgi:hypothetical protein